MRFLVSTEACNCLKDRLGLQYHSSATTVWPIVHDGVSVMGVASKIVDCDLYYAVLLGSLQDTF